MPNVWSIKRIKGSYYLYHRGKYVGPLDKIVEWWRARRDLNPGPPAPKAGALSRLGHGPFIILSDCGIYKESSLVMERSWQC